ncbi:MAG: UDP-glucose 4-epimerase GalE [Lewinella sp.]|jgi:UDP-glucose 4-epimerase|uniref:UDP-glucose 4-epimerase GalE n=1 Tax=Lewinella sp. TaxID=2004506 RepID=UPI003D6A1F66
MSKGKILVTGGCGYIGSHTIVDLIENGYEVVAVDNLSNADESVLKGIAEITGVNVKNHVVDLAEREATVRLFQEEAFNGVIHFAALKHVGESVHQPVRYYQNNLNSLLNVIEGMQATGCQHLIFSSSCSVYGNTDELPVTEKTPRQSAESPYGRTKQMCEDILFDVCKISPDFQAVLLRYFNPAGAHPSSLIGEAPSNPASNLAPVITETAMGKRKEMMVFGNDYNTSDGSCVRDYIHVVDLAHAHTLALDYLRENRQASNCELFNLGIGTGVSVLEAIHAFEEVTGIKLNYRIGDRRAGDVVSIYANADKASRELGWQPKYNIKDIMETAWAWEQKR